MKQSLCKSLSRAVSILLLAALLCLSLVSCNDGPDPTLDPNDCSFYATHRDITGHKVHRVVITIKDYGKILLLLDETAAPKTVQNFLSLVEDGFYDGLTFHRVIHGFMMQGGDPNGNGSGNPGYSIDGEFSSNGWTGNEDIKHLRGVISMARGNDFNSAGCQFFIMHQNYPSLDGQYAAFGYVEAGMEIVDRICYETPSGQNGAVKPANQPIIKSIRVVK